MPRGEDVPFGTECKHLRPPAIFVLTLEDNAARGLFPNANLVRGAFLARGDVMTIGRKGDGLDGALVTVKDSTRFAGFGIQDREHVLPRIHVPTDEQRFAVRVNACFSSAVASLPADFFPG